MPAEAVTEPKEPPMRIRVTYVSGPSTHARVAVIGKKSYDDTETSILTGLDPGRHIDFDVDEGKVLSLGIQNPDRSRIRKILRGEEK